MRQSGTETQKQFFSINYCQCLLLGRITNELRAKIYDSQAGKADVQAEGEEAMGLDKG